jgi:hypothetical protein
MSEGGMKGKKEPLFFWLILNDWELGRLTRACLTTVLDIRQQHPLSLRCSDAHVIWRNGNL